MLGLANSNTKPPFQFLLLQVDIQKSTFWLAVFRFAIIQIVELLGKSMHSICTESPDVQVYLDISPYWPKDFEGKPRSVNSVYEEIKGTVDEVGRNTLRLALDGKLDRGYFSNQVKLARLCSKWSQKKVTVLDLLRIENSG